MTVHALLSLQLKALGVKVQPVVGSQPSVVQYSPSAQARAEPMHAPCEHDSLTVHKSLSTQGVPLAMAVWLQPVEGLHASLVQAFLSSQMFAGWTCWQPSVASQVSVVHALPSSQPTVPLALQTPAVHVSPVVQGSLSTQARPSLALLNTQPVAGTHVSLVQTFVSSQTTAVPPQLPDVHLSAEVQALPSEHVLPSVRLL